MECIRTFINAFYAGMKLNIKFNYNKMEDKLILLKRQFPTEYEIHRYEINQTKNLILTTKDLNLAQDIVNGYNKLKIKS